MPLPAPPQPHSNCVMHTASRTPRWRAWPRRNLISVTGACDNSLFWQLALAGTPSFGNWHSRELPFLQKLQRVNEGMQQDLKEYMLKEDELRDNITELEAQQASVARRMIASVARRMIV